MISNSGHDERGKYSGGAAGDQTGGEWARISWYNRPWNFVIRHPDPGIRALIGQLAGEAADNNRIGYDQNQRTTFWQALKGSGYFPSKITVNCEADCSAGVAAIVKAAGYILSDTKLQNVSADMYTGNERSALKSAGFSILSESKYLTSEQYLLPGDILLCENHHTAINLDFGSKTVPTYSVDKHISLTDSLYRIARAGNYAYGDSHSYPPQYPCADHIVSCDRGAVAYPLYMMGYASQPGHGLSVMNMEPWLLSHGWYKVTNQNALKRGDIVLLRNAFESRDVWHTFLLTGFRSVNDLDKYDFGRQTRWTKDSQPYQHVPLIEKEWVGSKWFYCAFRFGKATPQPDDNYVFDPDYYRMAWPDVVRAVGSSSEALKKHYDQYGKTEGRAANCILTPSYYKGKYKDLRKAFGNNWTSYIDHFSSYGVQEGRRGSVVFDYSYYRNKYKDLVSAFKNDKAAYFRHFMSYGMKEGRQGSKDFDPRAYRKRYKDLDKAYGDNWKLYYMHYLIYGIKEKRKGN